MSIAEFYIEHGIDPSDPASYDAWAEGAADGDYDGGWVYAGMKACGGNQYGGGGYGEESEDEYDGYGNHSGPTAGGERERGSFGQKWRAVVQGKFRVHARDPANNYQHFDLFHSPAFAAAVKQHRDADKQNPHRTVAEKTQTLTFPGMKDKRNWVWYTDEHGVEHKPIFAGMPTGQPDMIGFWPITRYNPREKQETGQDAEDCFWTAAVLWKNFGTSGNPAYDDRFDAELAAFRKKCGGSRADATGGSSRSSGDGGVATTHNRETLKFFHGTSWDAAQQIKRDGFIESVSGCLGKGIYVARKEKAIRFVSVAFRFSLFWQYCACANPSRTPV
jgi:hypothetical protein